MVIKINISDKTGKTYKIETEEPVLVGKELKHKVSGTEVSPHLTGYELEITGVCDKSGFPARDDIEGIALGKKLLSYGKNMHKKPKKEGKKAWTNPRPKGLRLRKTVRGKVLSTEMSQINLKVLKEGARKLEEIFKKEEPVAQ